MRPGIHAISLPSEIADFADEIRGVFLELGRVSDPEWVAGGCSPAVDVYETDDAVEIAVDLPGVDLSAVRLLGKGSSVLIAGEKPPKRAEVDASFHLVERDYGRFARVVRLGHACDLSQARATLAEGELHISLPKIGERRGRLIAITISTTTPHG